MSLPREVHALWRKFAEKYKKSWNGDTLGSRGIYRRGHPPSYLECLSLQDFKNILAHVEFSGEFVCVCAFLFVFLFLNSFHHKLSEYVRLGGSVTPQLIDYLWSDYRHIHGHTYPNSTYRLGRVTTGEGDIATSSEWRDEDIYRIFPGEFSGLAFQ